MRFTESSIALLEPERCKWPRQTKSALAIVVRRLAVVSRRLSTELSKREKSRVKSVLPDVMLGTSSESTWVGLVYCSAFHSTYLRIVRPFTLFIDRFAMSASVG